MSNIAGAESRLALIGTLLMLTLVSVSAYLRLSAAGLGCEPWPACYAQASETAERQHHPAARLLHRALASTVGVIVLLVAFTDVRRTGRPRRIGRAVSLVAVIAALAGLGRITPGSTSLAVALGNLLGGAGLTALLWWAALDPRTPSTGSAAAPTVGFGFSRVRGLAYATFALVMIQFVLGALLSTTMAASACATTPLCTQDIPTSAATLHLAHRLLALALLFVAGGLAIALLPERGRARLCAMALGIVLILQGAAGASMLIFGFPLWLGLAHNLFGVLLLLAVLTAIEYPFKPSMPR